MPLSLEPSSFFQEEIKRFGLNKQLEFFFFFCFTKHVLFMLLCVNKVSLGLALYKVKVWVICTCTVLRGTIDPLG